MGKDDKVVPSVLREAPSGGVVASLIAIIGVIMVMYIIFLPPADRAALLSDGNYSGSSYGSRTNNSLFLAGPGTLDYRKESTTEHPLPNVQLMESRSAVQFEQFNPFVVRSGFFTKQDMKMTFHIDDPSVTKNVVLTFNAPKKAGALRIELNGYVLFEGEPQSSSVGPLEIRKDWLRQENDLRFSVEGVGIRFWSAHQYNIENAKIIGDVTDLSTQESTNTVVIGSAEFDAAEAAYLDYVPNCDTTTAGTLEIFINNRRVSSAIPVCATPNRITLDTQDLMSGKNTVYFKISQGSYSLEHIKLKLQLRKPIPFLEYFDVTSDDLKAIRNGKKALLKITFVNDKTEKYAELRFNDQTSVIRQDGSSFQKDVSKQLQVGQNYIQISPKTTLQVVKVEVVLQ